MADGCYCGGILGLFRERSQLCYWGIFLEELKPSHYAYVFGPSMCYRVCYQCDLEGASIHAGVS